MKIPILSMFVKSPLAHLEEHAEKVKECGWVFQQAVECQVTTNCQKFEDLKKEVLELEGEADAIKHRIRANIQQTTITHVRISQLFHYLVAQDAVLTPMERALEWIGYVPQPAIPKAVEKELFLLLESIIDPVEGLAEMMVQARAYFNNFSSKKRKETIKVIRELRKKERNARRAESLFKEKVFTLNPEPSTFFFMIRLAEIIGSIAGKVEDAGETMRAMLEMR